MIAMRFWMVRRRPTVRASEKTIRVPSGENSGSIESSRSRVSRRAPVPSAPTT
jgi:hypothetical protein